MAFIKAGPARVLPAGKMKQVDAEGHDLLIANLDGTYYAIGNVCTHMGCHLSQGRIDGQNVICPCHGSTFDLKTGNLVKGPARKPEPSYPVKVEAEEIIVEI